MVQVSGQKIIEVVEVPIAIAVPDARAGFFRNVPGEFGLISSPGLVEGRLDNGGDRRGRGSAQRSQQCARCRRRGGWTVTVDFVEIAILWDAVGAKIELLDEPHMCGEMHGRPEIEYVRNSIGVGYPSAEKRTGGGAGDQAVERFVQWRARSCRAVGERSD